MTHREIIADIKAHKFAPIYILMGEEPYYLDMITQALEDSVVQEEDKEFDQTLIFGADNNIGGVLESASRFPMMSPLQLVVLKEAQALHQAKANLDKLSAYVEKPNPNTVLAVVYKGDKLNATSVIMKAAKKNKDVVVFDSPKIRDYKIGGVIKDFCAARKIPIDDKAIEVLAASVGTSLSALFSEIEKLQVALCGENKRITAELVQENIGISKDFNNFELTAALAKRDYYQAINIVRHFADNPKSNPTVVTLSTIFLFYQRLLLAAFAADKSDRGLMDTLKLKTPYALREIRTGLASYNASQLVKAIRAIRDFDAKSKGIDSFQKEFPLLLELIFTLLTL